MALVRGCTYEVSAGRLVVGLVRVLGPPSPVDGLVPICANGVEMLVDPRRYTFTPTRAASKVQASHLDLYLIDLGRGLYKLGISADVERRRRQIRTYARRARLVYRARLPSDQTRLFCAFERAVLEQFESCRSRQGGREVLSMTPSQVVACKRAMRAVCQRGVAS